MAMAMSPNAVFCVCLLVRLTFVSSCALSQAQSATVSRTPGGAGAGIQACACGTMGGDHRKGCKMQNGVVAVEA
jgi:hypothetical protein